MKAIHYRLFLIIFFILLLGSAKAISGSGHDAGASVPQAGASISLVPSIAGASVSPVCRRGRLVPILNSQDLTNLTKDDSTKTIKYLGQWIGFFINYSNHNFSESFNLKALLGKFGELAEGLDLTGNPSLSIMLENFHRNTFINVYPSPIMNREEAIFERLNLLMRDWHQPMASPYISLFIYMDTYDDGTFSISFQMVPSENMGGMEKEIVDAMNAKMTGKFSAMSEARDQINDVIEEGLYQLEQKVKSRYVPDLTVWHDGTPYGTGQEIELWEGAGEAELYAAEKVEQGDSLTYQITPGIWTGTNVRSTGNYAYYTTAPGTFPLTFTSTDDKKVELTVRVKPGTGVPSLRSVLKALVREVLEEKEKGVTEKLNALRTDSVATKSKVDENVSAINSRFFTFSGQGSGEYVYSEFFLFNEDVKELTPSELETLKKNEQVGNYISNYAVFISLSRNIQKQLSIKEFLLTVIDDPVVFNAFIDDLMTNSGRLLARFALNALSEKDKSDMKTIVVEFLDEQIDKKTRY